MKSNRYILITALAGLLMALTASASAQMSYDSTVLEKTVQLNSQGEYEGQFDTLIAAIESADPVVQEVLADPESNITVFAPTDEAFSEIGVDETNVDQLSEQQLTQILVYHVSDGAKTAQEVMDTESIDTIDGQTIMVQEGVLVDQAGGQANITATDVQASNGVIHVIDSVLMPGQ